MAKPQSRQLTAKDIKQLTQQGCSAQEWETVWIAPDLDIARIENVQFSGEVTIGVQAKNISLNGTVDIPCGIRNSRIHNCTLGENILIDHVTSNLSNYIVQDDVIINNVNSLSVQGESAFGNGTEICPIIESGGREVKIFDTLTSQIAMMLAMFRDRPNMIDSLNKMIDESVESVKSSTGLIATGAQINNCGILTNIKVGPHASINGAAELTNGTINSSTYDPAIIGTGVIARNFICASGSKVADHAIIENCFVGQGVQLGLQYSAQNSLFFANCEGFHGEACSIFAGPYTVTHHKSTLLIAGMFSFMNAGSGSNQSNHKYKLGPVHQGIMERGCKLASDSYMMWPMKIGAFTLVMGRHHCNCDSSKLPFSYMLEENGQSVLLPGIILRGIGVVRDGQKWAKRDRRKDHNILDKVMTAPINPFTAGQIIQVIDLLNELKKKLGENDTSINYQGLTIKKPSIETGLKLYQLTIEEYLGNSLVEYLQGNPDANINDQSENLADMQNWIDLGGLIGPTSEIYRIFDELEKGNFDKIDTLTEQFGQLFSTFPHYQWAWATTITCKYCDCSLKELTRKHVISMIQKGLEASEELTKMRLQDAQKEFMPSDRVGFGIYGTEKLRDEEFEAVRGNFQTNNIVMAIKKQLKNKTTQATQVLKDLSGKTG